MPGIFEFSLQTMAKTMGWPIEWFIPAPGGRDQVFFRDIDMVAKADVVICVFPEDSPMEGGTAHVVEKAQDRRAPVYAYTDDGTGQWTRLGEWDPDEAWAHRVPAG
jgi:hypothetical protein